MTNPLEAYPVTKEIEVAWGEMDAFGHVNNMIYFRYFETARICYLEQTGLLELMADSGLGPILSETRARFKAPVTFPDRLKIGARVSAITGERFTMQYAIVSEKSGRIVTEGEALIVCFDYANGCKAAVTPALIAAIERLEGRSFEV